MRRQAPRISQKGFELRELGWPKLAEPTFASFMP